jgi:two-component system, OmpR family, alkaline phosphatase synthesis response regulator PhoP
MTGRILVVEDEESLRDLLKLNLEMEAYKVVTASDGFEALKIINEENFDLLILDIMLPGMDGLAICEAVRLKDKETPVLFLSAKGNTDDRIKGLKKGADDYLPKPFNLEELILRVGILVERKKKNKGKESTLKAYHFGGNFINFEKFEAKGVHGEFKLTNKEAMLLKLLIENRGEVVSREKILQTVWGYNVYPSTRTVDNFILSFRKYFENDPKNPEYFKSLWGVGYQFIPEKQDSE